MNYDHKFNKTEWLIIATARECHLYTIREENKNKQKKELKNKNA